jgi:hypothetical protein|tara:strand:+ start:1716 stop:2075 length:360 start_codon:yes stop_codon:yes gene_type:complete
LRPVLIVVVKDADGEISIVCPRRNWMTDLVVLNPEAISDGDLNVKPLADRPTSLDGLRLGLLWNDKRGGDIALKHFGKLFQERYKELTVNFYQGPRGYPDDLLDKAFEENDIFIGSTGD